MLTVLYSVYSAQLCYSFVPASLLMEVVPLSAPVLGVKLGQVYSKKISDYYIYE